MTKSYPKEIIDAAAGRREPDLLIKGGHMVDVFTGKISRQDIAVCRGRIVHIAPSIEGTAKSEIDASGLYVCPGFIDAHIHIESSMLVPSSFAQAVIPHGTTAVVADPHEIANCFGIQGVRFMIEEGKNSPVSFFFTAPSCVPAAPTLETSGAVLGPKEVAEMLDLDGVVGLGEMMNFPGVIFGDEQVLQKIQAARERSMAIDGHAPGLMGRQLSAYISAGIDSDHEAFSLEEGIEKLEKGMYLFIRQGTSARNLEALAPAVTKASIDRCCLVTDDKHPDDILRHGHLDHLLAQAVSLGIDPVDAIRMVTINPARRFGLSGYGAIAPGYRADLVLVKDIEGFRPECVIVDGKICFPEKDGKPFEGASAVEPPRAGLNIPDPSDLDFTITAPPSSGSSVDVRVIEMVPGELITKEKITQVRVEKGRAQPEAGRDIAMLFVIERHHGTGRIGKGFVKGLGLRRGAIASTVAHDSHNLIIAGMDQGSMISAASALKAAGGGLAAALGENVEVLPLPVAGLMSNAPAQEVTHGLEKVLAMAHELGIQMENPFMSLSFLALPVIPELKLTDMGLVNVNAFDFVPLFP